MIRANLKYKLKLVWLFLLVATFLIITLPIFFCFLYICILYMNPAQFVKISSLLLFRLVYAAPFGFIPLLQNFSPRGLRKNV